MEFTSEYLSAYLHGHEAEFFSDLAYIVSFPSIKSAAQPGAPFGPASARCLEAAAGLYRKYGFETEIFADDGYAMAYYGKKPVGEDKFTVVCAHSDVVPVNAADWLVTEPFRMAERNGCVVGRGVNDNKDAVIGCLYILRSMKDSGYIPAHTIAIFIGSNEEAGMKDIKNFRDKFLPHPAVSIVPDSAFSVSFGERGSFHSDISSNDALTDILEIKGGSAYNVVLGKFNCTMRNIPGLEKFLADNPREWLTYSVNEDKIKLVACGISAHGGRPYRGESALARFTAYLSGFDGLCATDAHIMKEAAAMLSDVYGINYGIDDNDPDMGKLTCANGKVFMDEGKLVFTLDIRFGPGVDKPACKKKLVDGLAARGFSAKNTEGNVSFKIDPENPLAKAIIESYRRRSGNPDAKPFYMSGGTYSKPLYHAGIMSFSTGVHCGGYMERLGLPSGHGNCHEADEALGKEESLKGITILGGMIADMDKAY